MGVAVCKEECVEMEKLEREIECILKGQDGAHSRFTKVLRLSQLLRERPGVLRADVR